MPRCFTICDFAKLVFDFAINSKITKFVFAMQKSDARQLTNFTTFQGSKQIEYRTVFCVTVWHRPVTRGRTGGEPTLTFLSPPLEKCVGHSYKIRAPQKTLRPTSCPELVTGLVWRDDPHDKNELSRLYSPKACFARHVSTSGISCFASPSVSTDLSKENKIFLCQPVAIKRSDSNCFPVRPSSMSHVAIVRPSASNLEHTSVFGSNTHLL